MSDVTSPIVVDTDPPSQGQQISVAAVVDSTRTFNGSVQEHFQHQQNSKHRNFLSGISEEAGAAEEIVELEDHDRILTGLGEDSTRGKPIPVPVRKTRSGASSSNASTKPSLLDNPKISTIRQHYYPEGGWGWVICACGFFIHMISTGLLLSYGVLYREILREFGEEYATEAMWLGSMSLSTGFFVSPLIVALCRRKSTRLTAVFGGLASALGCLFTSFASQMHQMFFSYGFLMALGLGLARETSSLMTGQYFRRKRESVEVIIQSGTGVGIIVFSYAFNHIIQALDWRLGLHAMTGVAVTPFFVGIFYRSASLYHPQRRAILHLKNQRKKIKDKSGVSDKPPFFDFTPLKGGSLIVTMVSSAICFLGLYAPFFHLIPILQNEVIDDESILRLQMFMGSAYSVGCIIFGMVVVRRSTECLVAKHYLCQVAMIGCGLSHLCLFALSGYNGYVIFTWMYGIFCGGLHYSLKMLVFENGRAKSFGRAWAYVEWAQSLPILFGIPATGYISKSHGDRAGFYFSATCCFVGAVSMSCINMYKYSYSVSRRTQGSCSTCTSQASSELRAQESIDTGMCTCTSNSVHSHNSAHGKCQKTISFASTVNIADVEDNDNNLLNDRHDYAARNHFRDNDPTVTSPKAFDKILVYEEEYTKGDAFAPGCGVVSVGIHENEFQCMCQERLDSPTMLKRKRPITVIEEVTSAV